MPQGERSMRGKIRTSANAAPVANVGWRLASVQRSETFRRSSFRLGAGLGISLRGRLGITLRGRRATSLRRFRLKHRATLVREINLTLAMRNEDPMRAQEICAEQHRCGALHPSR